MFKNYKLVHQEKYAHIVRTQQDDLMLSSQNLLHDQNIESGINTELSIKTDAGSITLA